MWRTVIARHAKLTQNSWKAKSHRRQPLENHGREQNHAAPVAPSTHEPLPRSRAALRQPVPAIAAVAAGADVQPPRKDRRTLSQTKEVAKKSSIIVDGERRGRTNRIPRARPLRHFRAVTSRCQVCRAPDRANHQSATRRRCTRGIGYVAQPTSVVGSKGRRRAARHDAIWNMTCSG